MHSGFISVISAFEELKLLLKYIFTYSTVHVTDKVEACITYLVDVVE